MTKAYIVIIEVVRHELFGHNGVATFSYVDLDDALAWQQTAEYTHGMMARIILEVISK